jgi:hypothetical protein
MSRVLVLLMTINVVVVIWVGGGDAPALLLYPRGQGLHGKSRVGYNYSPTRSLSLVFLIRVGLYLWGIFCRHLIVIWAYADAPWAC